MTLVELTVVLAVIAIVMTMVVSFTVLINKHKAKTSEEFLFLENIAKIKEEVLEWFTAVDGEVTKFEATDGELVAKVGATQSKAFYVSGVLTLGEDTFMLSGVDSIVFSSNEQLMKCTIYATINGSIRQSVFVFSPRAGQIILNQSQQGGSNA